MSEALNVTLPILRMVYPTESFTTGIGPLTEHLQRVLARREREATSKGWLEGAPETMRPLMLAMWSLIESRESGADPKVTSNALRHLGQEAASDE